MKLLLLCLLCIPSISLAAELCMDSTGSEEIQEQMEIKTDVPAFLKGATITVKLSNGKESTVPAEMFKVVPRKQQFIVSKTKQIDKTYCVQTAKKAPLNRISLLGGQGPKEGLERSSDGSTVSVESRVGTIGGAQYQRLLTERISAGVQLQTNKSALVELGLDF